jgi:two-component system, LuxR family, sensor kinase FixL
LSSTLRRRRSRRPTAPPRSYDDYGLVRLDRGNRTAWRVDQIIREIIDLCQPDIERQAVNVRLAISQDLPPVMVDARQIEQVLINLVRNSIDAIGAVEQGTVSIEATLADMNFIEVRV